MNTIIINEKPECAGNRIEGHSDLPCQTENIVLPSNTEIHIADETYLNVNNCSVLLRVTCLNLGKKYLTDLLRICLGGNFALTRQDVQRISLFGSI